MDQFSKIKQQISSINDNIELLTKERRLCEDKYLDNLQHKVTGTISIPNLSHSSFISKWFKYHQNKPAIPFEIMESIYFNINNSSLVLYVANKLELKDYDYNNNSGVIDLSSSDNSFTTFIKSLNRDDMKDANGDLTKDAELLVSPVYTESKLTPFNTNISHLLNEGKTNILLMREELGTKYIDDIISKFSDISAQSIISYYKNTNFKLSQSSIESLPITLSNRLSTIKNEVLSISNLDDSIFANGEGDLKHILELKKTFVDNDLVVNLSSELKKHKNNNNNKKI